MRAEVKLGLGVSAVICTVVGGYFMFGRQKESNIPVNAIPVASNTPAKPGTPNKVDPTKSAATNPNNKARPTNPAKPNTPNTSNPRMAANPAGNQTGATPTTANPTGAAAANPASTENPSLAANQPKSVWPPSPGEAATDTVAGKTSADQPATQAPPAMPTTTLSATATPPTTPNSEVNQPVKTAATPESTTMENKNANPTMQPNRVPPAPNPAQPSTSSKPSSPTAANPQPNSSTPNVATPETKMANAKTDNAAIETHKVQPGDTFAKLAESYYGDAKLEQFLKESNKDLGDPRRLSVGMLVKIPPKPVAGNGTAASKLVKKDNKEATDAKPTADKLKSTGTKTYTVKAGDSFYSIAKAQLGNSARWKQLYALNKKAVDNDPTNLRPGQVLKLPDEETSKTTP